MHVVAGSVEHSVCAAHVVVTQLPTVFVSDNVVLASEYVQGRSLERVRVSSLRLNVQRIVGRDPVHDCLVRATKPRHHIFGERGESVYGLNDAHRLEVVARFTRRYENIHVGMNDLARWQYAPVMGRFYRTGEGGESKNLVAQLVREIARDHAAERVPDHRKRLIAQVFTDLRDHTVGDLLRTGGVA